MIDLEKLVPLPEPTRILNWQFVFTAADMAAFRQLVAQEVARRCMDVVTRRGATFEPWVTENASNAHRKIAWAIAAEFGLGGA